MSTAAVADQNAATLGELAPLESRLKAFVLDSLLAIGPLLAGALSLSGSGVVIASLITAVIALGQAASAASTGQTWGKKKAGIRVVDSSGRPASGEQIVARRNLLPFLCIFALAFFLIPESDSRGGQGALNALDDFFVWGERLVATWGFFALGCMSIFSSARRTIQDYIAGTIVVVDGHREGSAS